MGSERLGLPSKYQSWHDQIVDKARRRKPLGCYHESHHVVPRSLGGSDDGDNLVDLTYREHFLVHWLLTKIHRGSARRKMQRAMFAMVLNVPGRDIADWQFDVAKRTVYVLETDPVAEAIWLERFRIAEAERAKKRKYRLLVRNGRRKREREKNKAAVELHISTGARPNRAELMRMANSMLNPRVSGRWPSAASHARAPESAVV